jgi:SagB-type dehydrogenase family enzyme
LSDQLISNLLWSANGVNREDGKRTAPSASNCQEIDIYLFTKTAIYFYDAVNNTLILKKEGDFRTQAGRNDFFANAPIALAFVGNFDKMAKYDAEAQAFYSATDVGFVSQNVYLFCASENLSTVVCGNIDREAIKTLLEITNGKVLLTHPVGYAE